MKSEANLKRQSYLGLFMITLATLMYEILLSRIFSVTMWYHFAFVAISVAVFGMTAGAILVYLLPGFFREEKVRHHLALSSLFFAVSIIVSFLAHLRISFSFDKSIFGSFTVPLIYVVVSVPFIFSGICVCLALTKFPRQVSKLYSADLAGAALGCILVIYTLKITDGLTAIFVVALFASIGAAFFTVGENFVKLRRIVLVLSLLLASFVIIHTVLVYRQSPLLRLIWVKGEREERPIYEKWNSFSRITVSGDQDKLTKPFGWGLSSLYPSDRKVRQLNMRIDATAETVLTAFDGELNNLEHLKYDITNLVHYLRPDSKVLVVGAGGGRDILSALVFKQKSVVGVEINGDIVNAVNQRFGDFTGHLDKDPRVNFVNDEARSYIARQKEKFDIIQVSLADTWAATAAGAFALAESSLYTIEAWKIFLEHLTPNGILTFSRWYFRYIPGEIYRLASLASATLLHLNIKNPSDHIVIVRQMLGEKGDAPDGIGTLLLSKQPFSDKDLKLLDQITCKMNFELVFSSGYSIDSNFAALTSGRILDGHTTKFPLDISAPTDDRPFFFHMLRIQDVFKRELLDQGEMNFNIKAVFILAVLLFTVIALVLLFIGVPLFLTFRKVVFKGTLPLFIFFASIGFGFMFVEISQLQRMIIFLGHPTYGLSVVLFALLLSSGIGSYSTQKIDCFEKIYFSRIRLLFLLLVLVIFGVITPYVLRTFQATVTILRIFVAVGLLFPLGFFMGMAFPLGMKMSSIRSQSLTPWLWGINGSTSICASVLAVAIAMSSSISTTFWVGFFCYSIAFASFVWAAKKII